MKQEFEAGPLLIRLDFLLVILGSALVSSPLLAICLAAAITVHELGHTVAARWIGGQKARCVLQLSGGRVYLPNGVDRRKRALILLGGPIASGALVVIAARLMRIDALFGTAYELFYAALVWTGYQLAPFPPLDGGQLLRMALEKRIQSATWIWRLSWLVGLGYVASIVALDHAFFEPAIWLTGMAAILGRGEAGYVRHLDAWTAWEKGDHALVVRRARTVPDYVDRRDRIPILSLGVTAALELNDQAAVEELSGKLPAHEPAAIEAATWLLLREKPYGAKLAERAFDALDAERIERGKIEEERWSEMAFRLAVFEAAELRADSALGVLERAIDLGYSHLDRIEAEPSFARLTDHPRWKKIIERLAPT